MAFMKKSKTRKSAITKSRAGRRHDYDEDDSNDSNSEATGIDEMGDMGEAKMRKIRIQSYQDFYKHYSTKGEIYRRYPFIQIQKTRAASGAPCTCFVHELLSMDHESHNGFYEEFKRYILLQNETMGLLKVDHMFVKLDDEMEKKRMDLNNRYYYITSTEKFTSLGDVSSEIKAVQVEKWFRSAFETLKFLHERDFVFRNIHSGSLVIVEGDELRFTMPGIGWDHFVEFIEDVEDVVDPEVYNENRFTIKSDIYSVAMVFRNLISDGFGDVYEKYRTAIPNLVEVIENCVSEDPEERPSVQQVLDNLSRMKKFKKKPMLSNFEIAQQRKQQQQQQKLENLKNVAMISQSSALEMKASALEKNAQVFYDQAPAAKMGSKRSSKRKKSSRAKSKSSSSGGGGWLGGIFGGKKHKALAYNDSEMMMNDDDGDDDFNAVDEISEMPREAKMETGKRDEWMFEMEHPKVMEEQKMMKSVDVDKYADSDDEDALIEELEDAEGEEAIISIEDDLKKKKEVEEEEEADESSSATSLKSSGDDDGTSFGKDKKKEKKKRKRFVLPPTQQPYDFLSKVILIGDSGVGKSSILDQYINKSMDESYTASVGVDFGVKTEQLSASQGNKVVKLQVWDTAGQERFRTITNSYYRGAHVALIVFDLTSERSFKEACATWLVDVKNMADENVLVVMVGNKCDLREQHKVPKEEIDVFCRANGMLYYETSAKTGVNIPQLFHEISEKFYEMLQVNNLLSDGMASADRLDGSVQLREAHGRRKHSSKGCGGGGGGLALPGWLSGLWGFFSEKKGDDIGVEVIPPRPKKKPPVVAPVVVEEEEEEEIIEVKMKKPEEQVTIEEDEQSIRLIQKTKGQNEGSDVVIYKEPVSIEEEGLRKKKMYETLRIIGTGGQSSVYLVEHIETRKQYTIKRYKTGIDESEYHLEVAALRTFSTDEASDNNHIVQFEDAFQYTDNYGEINKFIVMEYCEKGDLAKYLRRMSRKKKISHQDYFQFVKQLCLGVQQIHKKGFVHHDLKPANIFITEDLEFKIGDFGFCMREGTTDLEEYSAKGGTLKYMSPEQKSGVFCKKFLDIWSLGLICIEMMLKRLNPRGMKDMKVLVEKLEVDQKFQETVKGCLNPLPNERPSCDDMLKITDELIVEEEEEEGEGGD